MSTPWIVSAVIAVALAVTLWSLWRARATSRDLTRALADARANADDVRATAQARASGIELLQVALADARQGTLAQTQQLTQAQAQRADAQRLAEAQAREVAQLQAALATASAHGRALEVANQQITKEKSDLSVQIERLNASLTHMQRAAQTTNTQTPDVARLQANREAALNQRVRQLEDALQESLNRAAQAEAHEGSAAQLQQHIRDLKAKLQAMRERERAILKVTQEEVAALNETASRAYARGLVEGVCIDGVISPTEKARVDQWFANNGFPAEWAQRLFQEVQEQYDAQWLASDDPSPPPSDAPAAAPDPGPADKVARLRDLIAATAADGLISYEELRMLQRWAEENGVSAQALRGLLLDAKRAHPSALLIQSSPRALSNKEKGDAFERYVVSRFSSKHFKLLDWRGDKVTAEGKFAQASMLPDLELALCLGNEQHRFAVECKWRSNSGPAGEVTWCREEQLARYQRFEAERREPVFVVLGLGGMPQEPNRVFSIPLRDLSSPTVTRAQLAPHQHDPAKPFFYDPKERTLR